jgi:hypothetical protein
MPFEHPITRRLPPALIRLDLSHCEFNSIGLRSIFSVVFRNDSKAHIFQIAEIKFRMAAFYFLEEFDESPEGDHISEFDWSGNRLSKELATNLFALLAKERKLRIANLENILVGFPHDEFLEMLVRFVFRKG